MKHAFIRLLAGLFFLYPALCAAERQPSSLAHAVLSQKVSEDAAKGRAVAVYVTGKGAGNGFGAAKGAADPETGRSITIDTPLRIASNTKTFVAAAALRLVEEGKLDLESPIAPLLTPALDALLRADGYATGKITLRQLMSHSSGMYDHGADPRYFQTIIADPGHKWTREEQVRLSMDYADPQGPPGGAFRYSDTGYVLLGDIVERAADEPLPAAVRRLLKLDSLGLKSTWWETAETAPRGAEARARQYLGKAEGTNWDPSMDMYGGGGLVMSARDLATFFAALFEGRVFDRQETMREMLWQGTHKGGDYYRLGLFADKVGDEVYYWHGGFWGTIAYYAPSTGKAAAGIVTNSQGYARIKEIVGEAVGIPEGKVPPLSLPR